MTSGEFSGGEASVKAKLEELGFDVTNARPPAEATPADGELVLPQAEVDAFAAVLPTQKYKKEERNYKVAVHYVLGSLLSTERLTAPEFPDLLGAFFDGKLDLDRLDLAEDKRRFIDEEVGEMKDVKAGFINLCGGGFGVNNFSWIPGAIRDGLGEEIGQIFADLVTSDAAISERVDQFRPAFAEIEERAARLQSWNPNHSVRKPTLAFVAAVLMAVDPHRFSPYLSNKIKPAYEEFVGEWPGEPLGERYAQVVSFVVQVSGALERQGAPVQDLIDAQGFLYLRDHNGPPVKQKPTTKTVDVPGQPPLPAVTAELARSLFFPEDWLQNIVELLGEKQQVIFYGPPGTGKTYIAQALGEHLSDGGGEVRLVQFHPSYTYEDFFEGYRPDRCRGSGDGFRAYARRPARLVAKARMTHPDKTHILIVDEINRGNVAKVFGELYFLLEYRNKPIELQYSRDEKFALPENLFLIGTMNTADRSIALVDSALRRRFYFVPFLPTEATIRDVFPNGSSITTSSRSRLSCLTP